MREFAVGAGGQGGLYGGDHGVVLVAYRLQGHFAEGLGIVQPLIGLFAL